MIEKIFVTFATICIIIVFGYVICGLIHAFFHGFDLWEKMKITIRLPKRKKYLIKVDPIYELTDGESFSSSYYIKKWSLSYEFKPIIQFWLLIIPYPIEILVWKYHEENTHFICEKSEILNITGTLEENYNRLHEEWSIKNEINTEKYINKENKINELNKVFNENYE